MQENVTTCNSSSTKWTSIWALFALLCGPKSGLMKETRHKAWGNYLLVLPSMAQNLHQKHFAVLSQIRTHSHCYVFLDPVGFKFSGVHCQRRNFHKATQKKENAAQRKNVCQMWPLKNPSLNSLQVQGRAEIMTVFFQTTTTITTSNTR